MQRIDDIKILGTGTGRHRIISETIKRYLEAAQIDTKIREFKDVDSFLASGVDSIPAVINKGKVLNVGTNGSFNKSLRAIIKEILQASNYGKMKKIVLPVDLSETSINAFAYGHRLATDMKAIIKALHVYAPNSKDILDLNKLNTDLEAERKSQFETFVDTFDKDWGSDMVTNALIDDEFKVGFPVEEILESIDENDSYLVVIGTKGKKNILKKWIGSVSLDVVNKSPCPVLLIPQECSYKGAHKIAFAYEDVVSCLRALPFLNDFCLKTKAALYLFHVGDKKLEDHDQLVVTTQSDYPELKTIFDHRKASNIVPALLELCNEYHIDVLSVSTFQKSLFQIIADDNITRSLALLSKLPLLVIK